MAKDVNKVIVTGRLTQDVELRYIASGTAVCDVRLAVNRSIKKGDSFTEEVAYIDVTLWGKRAERIAENGGKGSTLFVEGHIKMDEWQDKESGAKRSKLKIESEAAMLIVVEKPKAEQQSEPDPGPDDKADELFDSGIPF